VSGETEANISGWTTDTLRTLTEQALNEIRMLVDERNIRYDQRFEAQQEALAAALLAQKEAVLTAMIAAEKAVAKAEAATERRFEGVNEFRGQLADQAATLMSRVEYSAAHQSLVQRIDDLSSRLDRIEGQSVGMNRGWGYTAAVLGLGLSVIGVLIVIFK
jgi:predicted  nucleic acid-binding Zn-ribbon protein